MNSTSLPAPLVIEDDSAAGVRRARDIARLFAENLEPAPNPDTADSLALVVSELTTNALRHGGGHYALELSADPDGVSIMVGDPSPALPREREPDLNGGTGGFGWHMIRSLARSVTITPGPGCGKTIRVLLPR
ncbi:ATP-binding protein [Streptomyces sp. H34-S4]|uniref:ATP-binding protein n=1 Tax=Streptomyces sp. H34-S4 TaxID=2996463 RepID=UPI002270E4C9|nr:ATP-binding protein [Streptomyces sp. H34-S4]MCY0939368.1 ATP-binding protein [Streptomyces sp. H34-S4]